MNTDIATQTPSTFLETQLWMLLPIHNMFPPTNLFHPQIITAKPGLSIDTPCLALSRARCHQFRRHIARSPRLEFTAVRVASQQDLQSTKTCSLRICITTTPILSLCSSTITSPNICHITYSTNNINPCRFLRIHRCSINP